MSVSVKLNYNENIYIYMKYLILFINAEFLYTKKTKNECDLTMKFKNYFIQQANDISFPDVWGFLYHSKNFLR